MRASKSKSKSKQTPPPMTAEKLALRAEQQARRASAESQRLRTQAALLRRWGGSDVIPGQPPWKPLLGEQIARVEGEQAIVVTVVHVTPATVHVQRPGVVYPEIFRYSTKRGGWTRWVTGTKTAHLCAVRPEDLMARDRAKATEVLRARVIGALGDASLEQLKSCAATLDLEDA